MRPYEKPSVTSAMLIARRDSKSGSSLHSGAHETRTPRRPRLQGKSKRGVAAAAPTFECTLGDIVSGESPGAPRGPKLVDPPAILDLVGHNFEPEPLLQRPGHGSAHRVDPPACHGNDIIDGGATGCLEHRDQCNGQSQGDEACAGQRVCVASAGEKAQSFSSFSHRPRNHPAGRDEV